MRISRLLPTQTSKRVRNAAPPRQRFSLAVSSSKEKPRASLPRTRSGKRTEILRSDLSLVMSLVWLMGWSSPVGHLASKKALHVLDHFSWRASRMHDPAKFAAVRDTVRKPTCELFHFSHTIGEI